MRKKASSLLLLFVSLGLVAFTPVYSLKAHSTLSVEVPSEVAIGTKINVSMINIEHNGETKEATSCMVHTPSGAVINSTEVNFSEAGKYIFEFSASFGEEIITKTLETMSIRTPLSMFSASGSTISKGSFAYNDALDPSVGVSEYSGIRINSREGDPITFNKILDFSNASKDLSFIDFIVEPSSPGAYDLGELVITLTDADDPNNFVNIKYVDGLAGSGGATRLTYATAKAADQYYAGYENWADQWHVNNDQTGAPTFLTFRGLSEDAIRNTGYLNSQLFFDYSSKQIFVKSEYDVVGNTVLVNDLDNPTIYPANPWTGFKNGKAILSITANDVSGTGAKIIIKSIFGYDFSQELLRDNAAPEITIDFDGYDKFDLPLAKKEGKYPIFKANVFDNFDDDLLLKTKVQYYDKYSETYIDIANNGDNFVPSYFGKYIVSYCCSDYSGNYAEQSYEVYCSPIIKDIDLIVPEDTSIHRVFEEVNLCSLDDVIVKNAQGKVNIKRYLISPDSTEVELKDNSFTPTSIAIYKVKYVVSDIYENPVTKIVDFDIQNIEHPIIVDYIDLPPVMIRGQYYDIPRIGCKYPNGNEIVDGEVSVNVNGLSYTDSKLHVETLDDIVIDFIPHNSFENRKTFTVKVVDGTDSNGRTIKSNYFYSSDNNYGVENVQGKATQFTINSENEISFIKSISSNDLSLSFELDDGTMANYSHFYIKIRDRFNKDKCVTLKIAPSSGTMKMFVPYDNYSKELANESGVFEIYYRPYYKTIRDLNYNDVCKIKYYDNGNDFEGFSDEVYVSFGFMNLENPAKASVYFINNQSFKTSIVKDNAGPQIITDSNLNWANELGEEITISKASAFDVLSYVEYLYVTMTDSTGNKILNKADASIDYKVTLNKYGNYRIEYSSKDGNGRTSNRSLTICCIENEKPELTVNFTPANYYSVGSVFTLPTYTFSDNSHNCTLDVSLYLPNNQGIAIEHSQMVDGEIYKENYLDLDHYSEQLVQSENAVKLYMAGKYTLRYLAVDAYGNVTIKEFVLEVR